MRGLRLFTRPLCTAVAGNKLAGRAVCTSAQTISTQRVRIALRLPAATTTMLFIVGVSIALLSIGIIPRMWGPSKASSANLGWMSEQWLAEQRASHSP